MQFELKFELSFTPRLLFLDQIFRSFNIRYEFHPPD